MSQVKITRQVIKPIHEGETPRMLLSHEYLSQADIKLLIEAISGALHEGLFDDKQDERLSEISTLLMHTDEWE